MSHREIVAYFAPLEQSLKSYDSAFRILVGLALHRTVDLDTASLTSVGSLTEEMVLGARNHAHNAHCLHLLFPHLRHLQFETVLRCPEASWGRCTPSYAAHLDALIFFCKLMDHYPYDPTLCLQCVCGSFWSCDFFTCTVL